MGTIAEKVRHLAVLIAASALLCYLLPCDIQAIPEETKAIPISATLYSYDYGEEWNWGHDYTSYLEVPRQGMVQYIDYPGMDAATKRSMQTETGKWRKYCMRIRISPASDPENVINPIFGRTMRIFNVTIKNAKELGIYVRSDMMLSADCYRTRYNDWREAEERNYAWSYMPYSFDDLETQSTEIWNRQIAANENEWMLEAVVFVEGKTEESIEAQIQKLQLTFDVEIKAGEEIIMIPGNEVIANNAVRETRYEEGNVAFIASSFGKYQTISDIMYYEELGGYYCFSGENADDILRKMEETPDDYMVITLQIELVKRLNWGLCNIVPELASEYEDICWLLFKRNENDNHLDKWFNANNEFMHTFHIVMKTNDKTPQEMKLMLQEMKIDMSFSTEFMGRNLWTGGNDASDGYPGVRFAVGLDMSRLLTSEEVWALNGNEDG